MDNMLQTQFFALLRAGLWNTAPDSGLFSGAVDWESIYRMASRQTVTAIVWDGLSMLPAGLQPPKMLAIRWCSSAARTEQANEQLNAMVVKMIGLYEQKGLHPVLLKGAGLATLYPNPLHRGCGDIDIFIGEQGYEAANEAALEAGATGVEREATHHSHLHFGDIHVENHRKMAILFTPAIARRFDRRLAEWYPLSPDTIRINGQPVPVPPMEFNIQFVFLHMHRHFFAMGIGLRQLCDWAMLLNKANLKDTKLIGHKRSWQVLGAILVEYLGLDAAKLPGYSPRMRKKAESALQIILADGNFGSSNTPFLTKRPKGYIAGKLFSLRFQAARWGRIFRILPADTLRYTVVFKIKDSIRAIRKEKF